MIVGSLASPASQLYAELEQAKADKRIALEIIFAQAFALQQRMARLSKFDFICPPILDKWEGEG